MYMANQQLSREIRRTVDTGKVVFGAKETETILLTGTCLAVVVSANIPKLVRERFDEYCTLAGVPLLAFDGTSNDLGNVCGKPFAISCMTVTDAGQSKILGEAATKTKKAKTSAKAYEG